MQLKNRDLQNKVSVINSLVRIFMKFHSLKFVDIFQFWSKSDGNNGHFT